MKLLLVWVMMALFGRGVCLYKQIFQRFNVRPLADEGKDDREIFFQKNLNNDLQCAYPTDCADALLCGHTKSGVYRVFPFGVGAGFLVACDLVSEDGGWLVIHNRQDGSEDFYRNWQNYTNGFGNLIGEFWLGLEKIHLLTSQRKYELLVELSNFEGVTRYARYSRFFVSGKDANFRLLVQGYRGNAGDSLQGHNGAEFSTYDRDNDLHKTVNCAERFHGAWWQFFQRFNVRPLADDEKDDTEICFQKNLNNDLHCEYPTDCAYVLLCGHTKSGVYRVFPFGVGDGFLVACDMVSEDGGWLVIHKRQDGSEDFYRNWQNYTDGFGNLIGEFWLGLEKIHLLTSQRKYELLVELSNFEGVTRYARYSRFFVSGKDANFRLLVQGYRGNAGDSLQVHNGAEFSTYDRDNDLHKTVNCAELYHGAWWYVNCHSSNLNGKYINAGGTEENAKTMSWKHFDNRKPRQTAEMKIRPLTLH